MASKKSGFQRWFFNCEEATELSTRMVHEEPVGFLVKWRFWIHNLCCWPCLHFHEDNKKLQKIIRYKPKDKTLSPAKKRMIQEELRRLGQG